MRTAVIALALLLAAAPANAQITPQQARALRHKSPVFVVTQDGTWTGRLTGMDATTITIQPHEGARLTWPLSDVVSVDTQKWDSPWDGAAAGGIAMAVWFLVADLTYAAEGRIRGAGFLGLTATGAFAGYAIDATHKSKVTVSLYERSPASTNAPGLFVTMRF